MRLEYKTKAELALEGLRDAILRGEIRPGKRVTQAQLSQRLGMSATPIREAIRILDAEGLLVYEPHRGITVNTMTLDEAAELYLLRAPMEGLAARLAVPNLTEADMAMLEQLQRDFEAAFAAGDDDRMTQVNADWHLLIYSATKTKYLVKVILRLWMPFHWSGWSGPWRAVNRADSVREHGAIMDAIRARDANRAARLMEEHIARVHRAMSEVARAQSDGVRGETD